MKEKPKIQTFFIIQLNGKEDILYLLFLVLVRILVRLPSSDTLAGHIGIFFVLLSICFKFTIDSHNFFGNDLILLVFRD